MRWCLDYLTLLFGSPRRAACACFGLGFVLLAAYDYSAFVLPVPTIDLHMVAYIAFNVVVFGVVMAALGTALGAWMRKKRYFSNQYSNLLTLTLSGVFVVALLLEPQRDPLAAAPVALLGVFCYCLGVAGLLAEHTHQQYASSKWLKARTREQRRGVLVERVKRS